MPTVLAMCNNPTTDGQLSWAGHEFVAYVDITPPVKTQEAHKAEFDKKEAFIRKQLKIIDDYLADEEDEDEIEVLEDDKQSNLQDLKEIQTLRSIPLPVEELSKIYYVGIDSVPSDLKVDIVVNGGCPAEAGRNMSSSGNDMLKAVKRHLKPGGKFYNNFDLAESQASFRDMFMAVFTKDVTKEKHLLGDQYYKARGAIFPTEYTVYTRNDVTGGRRRKTRRARGRKHTRKSR